MYPFFIFKRCFFVDIGAPGWPLGNNLYLNWPQLATLQTYPIIEYIYMWDPEKNLKVGKLQEGPFRNILFWEISFFKLFFRFFSFFNQKNFFFRIQKNLFTKFSYFLITSKKNQSKIMLISIFVDFLKVGLVNMKKVEKK